MKKFLLLLLACGMYVNAFAQNPLDPCCSIIHIDGLNNKATIRDKTTGRLYQFKADAMDIRAIQKGDAVNVAGGKINSINGASRTYVTVRPNPLEPCCSVVSIKPDPLEPCCAAVTIKNNSTNNTFSIGVPKQIAASLKPGQAISVDAANNLAVVQSSYGASNGEMSSYGYAMTSLGDNKNDLEPCCSIVSMNSSTNTALARDQITGRLYEFKADNMDMRSLQKGDAVSIATNKISAINGSARTYMTIKPDYLEPCCAVVSIQVDGIQPCCSAVTIKNNSTNNNFSLSVPKQIAANLKSGQAVSIDAANNLAVVQSSYGSDGEMNSYGYPATSTDGTTGNENTDKWVINKVNARSGTGKLFVKLPSGTEWDITIYAAGSTKVLSNTILQQTFSLLPGSYDLEINHIWIKGVPVEKGNDTRLKTGVLHISNPTSWTLYDAAKKIVVINSTTAQHRGVPIGKYKLTIMGQDQDIEIKDGETVEF